MGFARTERFKKDFRRLDVTARERVLTALEKFAVSERHPSLGVKKMEGTDAIWELRASDTLRITFQRTGEVVTLRRTGTHNVLGRP